MANLTETCGAWAANAGVAVDFFRDPNFSLTRLSILPSETAVDWASHGYTYIGIATVKVEPKQTEAEIIQAVIGTLRQARSRVYAEAEEKATRIEEQINRLLAIENKQVPASTVIVAAADEDDDIPF
jgi:hypothetical protein